LHRNARRTQHVGDAQSAQATVDSDTAKKLEEISAAYASNRDAVVKKLMDRVVLVEPALHRNLKKVQA
jgi:V-type H+-transporting ATPase subunit G